MNKSRITLRRRYCFVVLGCIFCLLTVGVSLYVLASKRDRTKFLCHGNLRKLRIALHAYHDVYKEYPPVHEEGAQRESAPSWRILLLPFLEEEELFRQYDFNESWDGPGNIKLLNRMPSVYRCPSCDHQNTTFTSYLMLTSDYSLSGACLHKTDIGEEYKKMAPVIIEIDTFTVPWLAPFDFSCEHLKNEYKDSQSIRRSGAHYEYFLGKGKVEASNVLTMLRGDHFIYNLSLDTAPDALMALRDPILSKRVEFTRPWGEDVFIQRAVLRDSIGPDKPTAVPFQRLIDERKTQHKIKASFQEKEN